MRRSGLRPDVIFRCGIDEPWMEALRLSLLNDCGHGTSPLTFYTALSPAGARSRYSGNILVQNREQIILQGLEGQ